MLKWTRRQVRAFFEGVHDENHRCVDVLEKRRNELVNGLARSGPHLLKWYAAQIRLVDDLLSIVYRRYSSFG